MATSGIFAPWRAFSFRSNWRHLVTPPSRSLHPVDGIRALSILWVILFHVCWFACFFIPAASVHRIASDPALRLIWCGDLGVDSFFTISGFLLADILMEEHDTTATIAVWRFYLRRALRTLPAYVLVLWIYCRLQLPHCSAVWANLLHLNNFIPVARQCMPWSWSLAMEEQFYLVLPLLLLVLCSLRPRSRLGLLWFLGMSALAISFWLVVAHGFSLPLVMFPSIDEAGAQRVFDILYDKPHARFGPLLIGVLATFLRRNTRLIPGLERHAGLATAGAAAALLTIAFISLYPSRDPALAHTPGWFSVVYLASFRQAFSAAVAYLLLISLSAHRPGQALGEFLSSRWWYPIAQLSYSAYLLHPICIIVMLRLLPPADDPSHASLVGYSLLGLALSFSCGTVVYLLVERPFMNLRAAWPQRRRPVSRR